MRIKLITTLEDKPAEKKVNKFLEENEDEIEVIEIRWKVFFIIHYIMIIYKRR